SFCIICIYDQNGFFQIDMLILCERYILIVEVKNWYGTIVFGENSQVTRIDSENKEEGFPNPIPQAKLQQYRLRRWLTSQGISNIPIDFLVVISFPSTIIKSAPPKNFIPEKVIHNSQLFFKVNALEETYPLPKLKMNQLHNLSKWLLHAHTPEKKNILTEFKISRDELIKGVICPDCQAAPMLKKSRKWICPTCKCTSPEAHLRALHDFQLLISDQITNRDARDFLQIDSPDQ